MNVFAQIKIKIYNSDTKKEVSYAPVRWKLLNTGQVLMSQTDRSGEISIYAQNSPVEVLISFLGFEIKKDTFYKDGNYAIYLIQDLKYLPEAVVTDQYTATNAEKSIHKVLVIDEKKIKAMAAVDLKDVLSNQINVKLTQDNLLGSSLSLQGVSGQNVKILLDGIPVIGRQNGNIDLSQINLNDIERIEIVEGPLSVAYGTNALAGAINIITKKKQLNRLDLGITAYYETIGKYNLSANLGLRKTNGIYKISLGRNYFDGWSEEDLPRYQDWKPKEQYFGRFQYLRKIGLFDLNLKIDGFNEKIINKGLPRMPYQETAFDEYYSTNRLDNSITATSKLKHNRYLNLIAAYNLYSRVKNRYLFNRVTLEKDLVPEANEQDTNRFSNFVFRGTYTKSLLEAKLNYQLGYDINLESGQGKRIDGKYAGIRDYAGFISVEYSPNKKINLKPGLRYSYNSAYSTIPLPSLNLKYSAKNGLVLRSSYARGFRAPDLKELYLYFVDVNHNVIGNPELDPERSNNFQLSLGKKLTYKKSILQPEIAISYNTIKDRILLTNVQGLTFTYLNLSHFKTLNSNAVLSLIDQKWTVNIGYAFNALSTSEKGFREPFYNHELNSSIGYYLAGPKIRLSLFAKYTGKSVTFMVNEIGEPLRGVTDGYFWSDFTASKPFFNSRFNLGLGLKNIAGITRIQNTGNTTGIHGSGSNGMLFATGRVYFVKLDYTFGKK